MGDVKPDASTGSGDGNRRDSPLRVVAAFALAVLLAVVVSTAVVALLGYPEAAFPQMAVTAAVTVVITVIILRRSAKRRS
jgi:multisubunit Na+/H+ antiporter MnhB subunit